ncbi:lysophospholipid acyltransferase family protein [Streptomyces sp. NPDC006261]|uniref:lysophospholipid acyltransferase family protein n=1 Tax=Streptomyces sp. NPDC006261 TaxID=3156739 RepID=UPI0033AAED80
MSAPRTAATSAWLPVAPCTPQACARHTGAVRAPLPAVLRLVAGCAWTLLGVACVLPVRLLGAAPRDRLVRRWARGVPRAFGVRVTARAGPYAQGVGGELVVANHVSWLDIPLVASVLPGRMLAKSEVGRWPLLGRLAGLGGTLFIDRDRLRALPGAVDTVAGALRSGSRVVAFPEGSTWCGRGSGGVFRPAVFQAAIDAEVPVRPVRITYRAPGAVAFVGDDPLAASLWRVVRAAGLTAAVDVLDPIPAGGHAGTPASGEPGRRALARTAGAAVADTDRTTTAPRAGVATWPMVPRPTEAQTAVASDRANRPAASVHH